MQEPISNQAQETEQAIPVEPVVAEVTGAQANAEARQHAFCGLDENGERVFMQVFEGASGFSFLSFFFGAIYWIYRKLYVEALIAWGVAVILGVIGVPAYVASIAVWTAGGFLFAQLYRSKYDRVVQRAQMDGLGEADVTKLAHDKGGVNIWATVIVAVLAAIAIILPYVLYGVQYYAQ